MTDNHNRPPVMIAGLGKSGKTAFICSLIQLGYQFKLNLAAFKPFDTGLLKRNADERSSDGELFCRNMTGEPMEVLVSPYLAHEQYPVEMAFRRDGIRINWGFLNERLDLLGGLYDLTLIELHGGICAPLTEEKSVSAWLKERGNPVIMLLNADGRQFEHNLAEISILKNLGLETELVITNTAPIEDQDLLFFMWEKYEQLADQELAGMIPFIRDLGFDYGRLAEKVEAAVPRLVDRLFTS